ncbi:MAG: flagellar hook-length control protein FliK [Rhodoferax sp.]
MTIETGPVLSGGKSPGVSHATGLKGKTGSADKSNAGLPTGFMAILAAMDTSSAGAEPVITESETPPVSGDAVAIGLAATTGMPFLAGFNLSPAVQMSVNTESATDQPGVATASAESSLTGADAVLSQPVLIGADAAPAQPVSVGTDAVPTVSMDPAVLAAQSLQAVATPAERVSAPADSPASAPVGGVSAGAKSMRAAIAQAGDVVSRDTTGEVAPEVTRKSLGKPSDASGKQTLADLAQFNPGKSNGQPDAKAQDFMQRVSSPQVAPAALELAVANAISPSRREDHVSERSIFKSGSTETTYAPQQPVTELTGNAPVSGSSDVASPMDAFVAEQISYWISNDVQNAEMKLDGIGDGPVGVSISMHGNEAHVTFRTDELQARQALENASLHLTDLLQREGLVLAGVSVGTSGAGDSGGQEPRPRQGAKAGTVVSAAVGAVDRRPVQGQAAGRALDIFV